MLSCVVVKRTKYLHAQHALNSAVRRFCAQNLFEHGSAVFSFTFGFRKEKTVEREKRQNKNSKFRHTKSFRMLFSAFDRG